jgi:hypothetical protein
MEKYDDNVKAYIAKPAVDPAGVRITPRKDGGRDSSTVGFKTSHLIFPLKKELRHVNK